MPQDNTEIAAQQAFEYTDALPAHKQQGFANALKRAGVKITDVTVRDVPEYVAVELEGLCEGATNRKNCAGESPLMVVKTLTLFPEAKDFDGYTGYMRVEAVTEDGEFVAFTHYMYSNDTGEKSPLFDWVESQTPPFLLKIAHMSTRRGFSVYRPIPAAPYAAS